MNDILRVAQEIPFPSSFFVGVDPLLTELPRNVLQFNRRREHLGDAISYHHRFVLMACLQERAGVILDGELLHVDEGHGLLIFPFQGHHFTRFENVDRASWLVTTFEYDDHETLTPMRNTPFTYEEPDRERLLRVTQAYRSWTNGDHERGQETSYELILLLSRLLQRQQRYVKKAGGASMAEVREHEMLQRLSVYVFDNLHRPISVEELARLVSLSPSRLRARFKQALGISLGRFIRRTRIHHACSLLHSTDHTVSEIAEACGFDSVFSFSRAFKQVISQSPRMFRDQVRGSQ